MLYALVSVAIVATYFLLRSRIIKREMTAIEHLIVVAIALTWPLVFLIVSIGGAVLAAFEIVSVLGRCVQENSMAPASRLWRDIEHALMKVVSSEEKETEE